MLVGDHQDGVPTPDPTTGPRYPLDTLMRDPSAFAAVGDRTTFDMILHDIVAEEAPRVFAVVQEYGECEDGRIAAWGMAFDDHAEVFHVDGGLVLTTVSAETAATRFQHGARVTARVVWIDELSCGSGEDD